MDRVVPRVAIRLVLVVAAAAGGAGCSIDFQRIRAGNELPIESYQDLEVGETDLDSALAELGAPDSVEHKAGKRDDYLWWYYLEDTTVRFRFQVPISFFGYRHDLFQYLADDEKTDKIGLVFDEHGTLTQKNLILAGPRREILARGDTDVDSPTEAGPPEPHWRLHLTPRAHYSFLLFGDADFADYDDLFENGFLLGADLAIQPVPPLTFRIGGHHQNYRGRDLSRSDVRYEFGDLELTTAEVGVRLQIPLRILLVLDDVDAMWGIIMADAPAAYDGWNLWIDAGLGGSYNSDVAVKIDGVPSGSFFRDSWQFTSAAMAGLEYSWKYASIRLGVGFRSQDAPDSGDSGLPSSAGNLQVWFGTAELAVKF